MVATPMENTIFFVKIELVRSRLGNRNTRGNMELCNHLLWFVCGLYVTSATSLNSHMYTGGLEPLAIGSRCAFVIM